MIEVIIRQYETDEQIARITIENVGGDAEYADYSVRFAADRGGGLGIHQRGVYAFPRTRYNVLALLKQALSTLEQDELELEDGASPSDLARRRRGIGAKVQAWADRLHHN